MKRLSTALHRDEGMSILEIMIAAVILFIILTGVLGLVGQTTLMGVSSKQKNVMVNATNAYVERVQALPFDSVGVVSVDDSGTLPAEETSVVGEFTVVIRPSVVDGANNALKNLTIRITVSAPGRVATSLTTTVPIRDRTQYMTQANRSPETDPSTEFNDLYTPPEATVVWEDMYSGGALKIAVITEAAEGRTLQNVALWVDDSYLLKNTLGETASWNPSAQTFSTSTFVWDTQQTEEVIQDDGSYLPVEIVADGMRTVSVYALDDQNVSVYSVRHFLVDNHEPGMPGRPVGVASSATAANVTWGEASDGTSPADHYQIRMFKQPINDSGPMNPFEHWPEVTIGAPTGASLSFTEGTAFSRYYPAVRALSPRNLPSAYTLDASTSAVPFVTQPRISGTVVATLQPTTGHGKNEVTGYWKLVSTLSCTPQTFATSSASVYTWYRVLPGGSPTVVGTNSTTLTDTYQLDGDPAVSAPAVRYYCVVRYTAAGVGATGASATINSNTVTVNATSSGTFTYAEGTW